MNTEDDDGSVGRKAQKTPPGAEHHGNGQKEPEGDGIHGMSHDAVQSGIHYLLSLLHLDGAGEVGVLAHDLGIEGIGDEKHRRCEDDRPRGDG